MNDQSMAENNRNQNAASTSANNQAGNDGNQLAASTPINNQQQQQNVNNKNALPKPNFPFVRQLSYDYDDKAKKVTSDSPAAQRLKILSMQSMKIEKRWNVFRSIPRDQETYEPRWTLLSAQLLKLVAYVVLHVIVCGSGLVAKTSMLLMVASVQSADRKYFPCRPYGNKKALIPQDPETHPANSVAWFYWYLWLAMCVPQILLLIRSVRVVTFKSVASPTIHLFFVAFFLESAQTVGVCLLIFAVLPGLDSVRASMLLASLGIIPALLRFLRHFGCSVSLGPKPDTPAHSESGVLARIERRWEHAKPILIILIDLFVFLGQSSALWVWPIFDPLHRSEIGSRILLPISILLSSLTFWENYVDKSKGPFILIQLADLRDRLQHVRYKTQIALTVWKCLLSLFFMIICGGARHSISALFDLTSPFSKWSNSTFTGKVPVEVREQDEFSYNVWLLFLTLIFSTFLCYQCARFACKVKMNRFGYALPTVAVLPLTTILIFSFCEARRYQTCYFAHWIPERLFWRCDYESIVNGLVEGRSAWAWILWLISYIALIRHVFDDVPGRLNRTDTIFINPVYDGLLVDHTLTLNRRRLEGKKIRTKDLKDDLNGELGGSVATEASVACSMTSMSLHVRKADTVTRIYICATMWHENREEMVQTLKSILMMDYDQSARSIAKDEFGVVDKDYYELEAHIFFDDAWTDNTELGCRGPNEFVELFMNSVDEAASAVYNVHMKLRPPAKMAVPYGGRLLWTLPGDNRLFVHLKDKQKIRNKKRWSQVMYMYYLLGHRVMEMIPDVNRKQLLADNTFILTIDGDSKFSPSAVQKLVDLMRKHSRLGSACGRIHPIGSGIMVWYQRFEYAIAHWFQKAAEHVFGCVLCSPGCFSLFRGSALMDDNVMNKYTKLAEEARHFVQYDQGEDRWLSTLLLKQGYRIEYAAAADAETHAPEGFNEFFNQRRRWTPSSTANTLDLLYDFQRAVRNNNSLSRFYIFYQMLVILFSLLSPAIIFTMMVFAQTATLPVSSSVVLWGNVLPVVSYCITCFIASSNTQLLYAKMLSIMYAFIMMAVLVGTGIQVTTEGAGSPISIFVMSLASIFFIAAFFHPHEFTNIFYGAIFFLMIPCTYVLLSLYALINLNVINWGTREAAERAAGRASETKWQQWKRRFCSRKKKGQGDPEANGTSLPDDAECGCPSFCICYLGPEERRRGLREGNDDQRFVCKGKHLELLESLNQDIKKIGTQLEEVTKRRSLWPSSLVLSTLPELGGYGHGDSKPSPSAGAGQGEAGPSTMQKKDESVMDAEETKIFRRFNSVPDNSLRPPTAAPRQPTVNGGSNSPQQQPLDNSLLPEEMPIIDADRYAQRTLPRSTGQSSLHAPVGPLDGESDSSMDSSRLGGEESGSESDIAAPKWMTLSYLGDGPNDTSMLDVTEKKFWVDLIEAYLKPIEKNPDDEARIADQLRSLRNKIAFGLLLINALLVLIIYLLQMHKELLSIDWNPTGNHTTIKRDPQTGQWRKFEGPLKIEPVGFMIIVFLSLILAIQTIGMVAHRWQTLQHTLASTVLPCFKRMNRSGQKLLVENAVEIIKRFQRLDGEDDQDPTDQDPSNAGQIPGAVVSNFEHHRKNKLKITGLKAAFKRRLERFDDKDGKMFRGIRLDKDNVLFQPPESQRKAVAQVLTEHRAASARRAANAASVLRVANGTTIRRSGSIISEDNVAEILGNAGGSGRRGRATGDVEGQRLDFDDVEPDEPRTGDGSPDFTRSRTGTTGTSGLQANAGPSTVPPPPSVSLATRRNSVQLAATPSPDQLATRPGPSVTFADQESKF